MCEKLKKKWVKNLVIAQLFKKCSLPWKNGNYVTLSNFKAEFIFLAYSITPLRILAIMSWRLLSKSGS